jgi:glycosyltransferase involved in cell wall biosynthesis
MPEPRKARVLLVLEATLGGTRRHVLDLTDHLSSRGYEVHLVYSNLRSDAQLGPGLERLRRSWPELRTYEIPITRGVTASDLRVFWHLYRYAKRNGPFQVVHGHSTKAGFISRLLPGVGGAARVYTPHALMTMDPALRGFSRWAVCALEAFLARFSHKVIVVSQQERRCALETGIPESKLALIENGVDTAELAARAEARWETRRALGIPDEAFCVGYVGRFCEQKEPGRVIEAFALLKEKSPRPVKLVMVGFGPLEGKLKARVADLGCGRDVIWPGAVDGQAHIAVLDVLAHCSRFEAFCMVILEALASGVPVVATRVGATEELLSDGKAGYICDPWTAEQFSELLLSIMERSALYPSLSEAARTAAAPFDIRRMVERTCEVYESVVSRHDAAARAVRTVTSSSI